MKTEAEKNTQDHVDTWQSYGAFMRANARLIAAAPAMFDMLTWIQATLNSDPDTDPSLIIAEVAGVLATARGE
jgi:hypothetical protein